MNHYFVAYHGSSRSGRDAFGHTLVDTDADMYTASGFATVREFIEKHSEFDSIVILNFIEMDD